ncbi:MAG: hypothetical protein LUF82_00940, partial [Clostridia bacterium]|nr:hypothetical protein [Clostridia bacterium]
AIFTGDSANYEAIANMTATLTISKISVTAPEADGTTFTYNGSEQTYTIASNELYTVTGNKQTNAGTYTVTVALNDATNYAWSDGTTAAKTYTFTIAKAANAVTDPTVNGTVVSGSVATYGSAVYKYYADADCTTELTDVSGYSTYYVRAEVAESDNYSGAVSGAVEVTVTAETPSTDDSSSDNTMAVVGITGTVVGGVAAIALAIALAFVIRKRKK